MKNDFLQLINCWLLLSFLGIRYLQLHLPLFSLICQLFNHFFLFNQLLPAFVNFILTFNFLVLKGAFQTYLHFFIIFHKHLGLCTGIIQIQVLICHALLALHRLLNPHHIFKLILRQMCSNLKFIVGLNLFLDLVLKSIIGFSQAFGLLL